MTTQARECGAKPRREEQPSSNAATTAAAATTPNHKTAAATATTDADTQRAVLPRSPTQRRQTRAILYRLARPPRPLPRPRNVDASASTHNDDTRGASDDRTRRPQYGACVDLLFHATSPLRRHHRDANDDNDDDDDDSRCCCFDNEPYQHDSALVPVSFYEEMARHIATDTTDTRNTTTTTADVVAVRPMSILPLTRTPTTNNNNDNNNDDNNNSCSSSDIAPSGAELRSPIFIRRVDAVPPIAMAQPLPCGTDVNMPTSNYLQLDASHNTHQHAPGFRRCEAAALRTLLDTAARDLERHGGATTASTSANNDNNNNNNNNNDEANVTVLTTRDALHSVFAHACARRHEQPLLLLRVQRTGPVLSIDCHRDAATIVTTTTTTTAADDDDAAAAREADEHGTLPSATTTTAAVTATTTTTTTTTMHTTRHASVRALRDKALLSKVLYRHVEAAQAATTTKITTTTCTVGDDSNEDDDEATRATSSRSPQLPPQRITPSLSQQHGALYDRYSQVLRLDTGRRVVYVGVDAPLVYNARDGTEQLLALRDTTRRQQHRRNHNDNSISNTHDDDDDDDDEDERRDALRCWFDATLTHTPQVGIYEHSAGVVERYEVARVRALLRQHEWQAATAALQVLLNVLEWLVRHCVRDAGTYVVVGGGGGGSSDGDDDDSSSSSLELYELPHSVHATTPKTMSSSSSSGERRHEARDEHAAAAAAEAAAQRRREQEELHVQLARMCYGMARHMLLQSPPPQQQQQTRAHAAGTLHNNNSSNKDDADVRVAHDAHTLLLRSFMVFVQHTDDPLHRVALRDLTQLLPLLIHRWLRGARADAHASLLAAHASAQRMLQRMLARLQHALRDGGGRTTAATRAVLHSCCASCATALLTLAAHALYACEDAHEQQQQQQHSDELAAEAVAATTTDVMSTLLLACVDDVARLQRLLAYLQRRLGVSLSQQQQQPQLPSDSDTSTSTRDNTTTSTRNANADDNNTRNATTASRQLVERSVCDVSLSPLCVALHELCGDAVCFAMTSNTAVQLLRDCAASVLQAQRKDDDDNDNNDNDDDDAAVTALLRRLSTLPDDVTALSFAALRFYAAAASVVVGSDSNSNSDAVVAAALRARRLAHVHFRVATAYHRAQRHTKALEALHSCKQQLQLALLSSSPPAALNNNNNNNNSTKKSSDGDDAAVVTSLSRAARLTRTDVARAVAAVYVDMLAAKAEQLTTPVAVALSPATVTTTTTTATATTTTKAVSVLSCQPLLIGAVYDVRDELERLLHSALDAYAECADDRHATDNNNNNSSRVHAQHQQRHDDDGRRACDGDAMTCARVELLLLRVHAHLHRLAAAATPCDRATCSRLLAYVREAQRLAPPSARWRGGCEWLLMRLYTATSPHATSAELHKSATTTLHRWCVAAMHDGVLHDDDDNEDDKSSNKVDDEDGGGGAADDDAVVSCLRCSQHDMIRQLQRGPATRVEWHLQLALVCCVAAERLCSSSSNNSSSGSHSKHHYYECQQWVRRASTLVNAAIDAFVDASARTQMTTAKTTTLQAAARSWHVSTPAMWLYRMASMVLLRTLTATRDGLASKQRRAAAAVMQTLLSLERDLHTTTATNDATTGALTSLQRALQPLLSW